MSDAFIYEAIRTPRGKQRGGSLHGTKPVDLVAGLGVEVGVGAQSLAHLATEHVVDGLAGRLTDDVPERHLDTAEAPHHCGVGAELEARTNWARHLETQLNEKIAHVRLMMAEQAEITGALERSRDAIVQLQAAVAGLREERRTAANSRWLRLGRTLHLGPDLRTPQE